MRKVLHNRETFSKRKVLNRSDARSSGLITALEGMIGNASTIKGIASTREQENDS